MALHDFIVKLLVNSVKSQVEFLSQFDTLKDKLAQGLVKEEDLIKIVKQKNQLASLLTKVQNNLLSITKTTSTVSDVLTTLKTTVNVLTKLPIPTATPPGVGVPFSALTTISDALDKLYDSIKENSGILKSISQIIEPIISILNEIAESLNSLNPIIDNIINDLTEEEYNIFLDNEVDKTLGEDASEDDKQILKSQLRNSTRLVKKKIKEGLILKIQFNTELLSTVPIPTDGKIPNLYKGYKLTIQYDPNNEFSFPSRRIQGKEINTNQILYNNEGKYSYSSSVEVLLDEIKFQIDSL